MTSNEAPRLSPAFRLKFERGTFYLLFEGLKKMSSRRWFLFDSSFLWFFGLPNPIDNCVSSLGVLELINQLIFGSVRTSDPTTRQIAVPARPLDLQRSMKLSSGNDA